MNRRNLQNNVGAIVMKGFAGSTGSGAGETSSMG
jgi:hypothetical protein